MGERAKVAKERRAEAEVRLAEARERTKQERWRFFGSLAVALSNVVCAGATYMAVVIVLPS